jgi:hypothetical protein
MVIVAGKLATTELGKAEMVNRFELLETAVKLMGVVLSVDRITDADAVPPSGAFMATLVGLGVMVPPPDVAGW